MNEELDEITLEIENNELKCSKKELIEHSDYFKAMFDGNFQESTKKLIKLEGIELKAMNIILKLLWDATYHIDSEDILIVLQTSTMLQFQDIQRICIDQIYELLKPQIAIKVWLAAESCGLLDLQRKALNLALIEFETIKTCYDTFNELNLKQLHAYLANQRLICVEIDVFIVCMQWYYENAFKNNELLIKLITTCVNFNDLNDSNLSEVVTYPDVAQNDKLIAVIDCYKQLRSSKSSDDSVSEEIITLATKLLHCKRRLKNFNILISTVRMNSSNEANANSCKDDADSLIASDALSDSFDFFMHLPDDKFVGCDGYQMLGYKEQVFMFGGEVQLGSGNWNLNVWVYDTIRERWERRTKLPFGRRHFQSCICGDYLFIVGGTGNYRIIQEDFFWYNCKTDVWSKRIVLPRPIFQLKICNYNKILLLISVQNRCGYLFNPSDGVFVFLEWIDKDQLVKTIDLKMYTLVSHLDCLYIKTATSLIELRVVDFAIIVNRVRRNRVVISTIVDVMESIVCQDNLYTIYKNNVLRTITIEKQSLMNYESRLLFDDVDEDTCIKVRDYDVRLGTYNKFFSLNYHFLCKSNCYINDL